MLHFHLVLSFYKTFVKKMILLFWLYWITLLKIEGVFLKLGFTPCKAEQPLQGMMLQEKQAQKD